MTYALFAAAEGLQLSCAAVSPSKGNADLMKNAREFTSIGLDFVEHDVFPREADIILGA